VKCTHKYAIQISDNAAAIIRDSNLGQRSGYLRSRLHLVDSNVNLQKRVIRVAHSSKIVWISVYATKSYGSYDRSLPLVERTVVLSNAQTSKGAGRARRARI